MVKITMDTDCGNSPKRVFLKDFNIAFVEANIDFIMQSVTDDIRWEMVGHDPIEGRDAFMKTLEDLKDASTAELIIKHVITHGREGALHGDIITKDGKVYQFCDVYEFKSAKGNQVKSIISFMIETTPTESDAHE